MPLRDICRDDVVTTRANATIQEAAGLMREHHVGSLIVVERIDGTVKPVGIITDRDIALTVAEARSPQDTAVKTVMTPSPKIAFADDGIAEVIALMRQYGVRRLPVVERGGGLVGVVASDDLVRLLASELSNLAEISDRQISREGTNEELVPQLTKAGPKKPTSTAH